MGVDSTILVYTGKLVDPFDLNVSNISIEDIVHALGRQCRFSGHVRGPAYTVAQHSVLVSQMVGQKHALWGLLHDASEAYLIDVPRPLKHSPMFAAYREAEARAMETICLVFDLPPDEPEEVRRADDLLLQLEQRSLMPERPGGWHHNIPPEMGFVRIEAWPPSWPEERFLERFAELYDGARW